jgi:protein-tyrosine-phosphatase
MARQFQILFICSGNICRSPMAEGYLRYQIPSKYKTMVRIQSAGTLGIEGAPASKAATDVMQEKSVDIQHHVSQGLNFNLVDSSDLILTMELEHYDFIKKQFRPKGKKLQLLGDIGGSEPCNDSGIFDPVGGDLGTFRDCRNLIINEIDRFLPKILKMIDNHFKR